MLKAKLFFEDVIHDVDTGTPQGGILSPMLANVALTALDEYCQREFGIVTPRPKRYGGGKYTQNPIIRYSVSSVVALFISYFPFKLSFSEKIAI